MALDLLFPLLSGRDARHLALKDLAQVCSQTSEPVLLLGELCMATDLWAQLCAVSTLQHYSLKPNEGVLGESQLWSSLRALMESQAAVLYLTGFSQLDPILKASLLDWLQTQAAAKKIILQSDSVPVAALQELSFYKRCRVLQLVPLKSRLGDLGEITAALLQTYNQRYAKTVKILQPQLLAWLQVYDWPGDLMELDSLMRDLVLRSDAEILRESDLSLAATQLRGPLDFREASMLKILKESASVEVVERFLGCEEGSLRRKLS